MSYKVAIIGAGASGLAAIKSCLEEGLVPLCFEKNEYIAGIWHYTGKVGDGQAMVMKSTLANDSKEMQAFSDFPPPKDYPPYISHWLQDEYFNLYADKFDLRKYISLKTEVVRVEETKDHAVSGQWVVTVKHVASGEAVSHSVNAVMLCSGPFAKPFTPTYDGIQDFQGKVLHSYEYLEPTGYEGKNVVVVGIGNTAVDIAVELSRTAKQVYLSARTGTWLYNRLGPNGIPADLFYNRIVGFLFSYLPNVIYRMLEKICSKKLDHQRYGLCPTASPGGCSSLINDDLPACLIQGSVQMTKGISYMNGNTVEFTDGSSVDNVDVIITATGHREYLPLLDKRFIDVDVTNLYKAIFPPDRKHHSLAMIGYYFLPGPNPPCAEMQCRVATRVFKGLVQLPSQEEMMKDIQRRKHHTATYRVAHKTHTIQVDWVPYMNELAPMIGVQPNIFWLLLTDWRLGLQCLFGACTPYQFRLRGPGKWEGAREALMTQMDRTFYSLDHGMTRVTKKKKKGVLGRVILWSLPMFATYFVYKHNDVIIAFLRSHTLFLR